MFCAIQFFVTPAPGYAGDVCYVLSAHRTLAAARKAAGASGRYVVRRGGLAKGCPFYRDAGLLYNIVMEG